jgi:uncharacterized protein DUF6600
MRTLPRFLPLVALLLFSLLFLGATCGVRLGVVVPLGPYPHHPPGTVDSGLDVFWDPLSPYGDWVWLDAYGWVWTPHGLEPGWLPYTHGHWVYTSFGWTWVSDYPWGWAPFHYGRWTHEPLYGWAWVPGDVWGPAWVAWRMGDGWIGWAPLPPRVGWRVGIGLDLGGVDLDIGDVGLGTFWWSFVGTERFADRRLHDHLAPHPRNEHLLRRTHDVTRFEPGDRGAVERGLPVEPIERATGRPVPRYQIEDLPQPPERAVGEDGRRSLPVFRPEVPASPPPERQRRERPPAPPAPARDQRQVDREQQRERRDLDAWEQRERQRLETEQRRERERPPAGVSAPELKERQDQERRDLDRDVQRERDTRAKRWEREKQPEQKPARPPKKQARPPEKPPKPPNPA